MSSSEFDLITIGNACVDIFLPAHEAPPRGGITRIPTLNMVPGGNGLNTAVTAARLGVRSAFAGVLGDDVLGRHLRDFLAGEGVDTSLLELRRGRSSPATIVQNDASGERSFVHHAGTNADCAPPRALFDVPARIVHFAAPELLGALWPDGAVAAACELKDRGRTITLDIFQVPGEEAPPEIVRRHRPLLEQTDMVFPNEEEARLISGRSEWFEMAQYFHDLGIQVVAIKRGAAGALLSTGGKLLEIPTAIVEVVDTCGAGDNFAGGFLAGAIRGLDPPACARLGCALGTLAVTHQGSLTATARPEELRAVLERFAFPS
jgi:ribokinase